VAFFISLPSQATGAPVAFFISADLRCESNHFSNEMVREEELTMNLNKPLFEGEGVSLAPIDREKDAEIEARWTQDAAYLRLLGTEPALPSSPERIRKRYETIEKEVEQERNHFYFTIRLRPDDRLIGFIRLYWIEWAMSYGSIQLGIGEAAERGKGYGAQALELMLRYAFSELNLYRLNAVIQEYNQPALRLFQKAGFVEEVCQRQALYKDGRRWDRIMLGMLRDEWRVRHG
jgi:RimJ/RimL family protein N-acetyltransferase